MTVTEKPSDFGRRRGTVVYSGTCCCCCCCCLWSIGAIAGAGTGFLIARGKGKHRFRDLPLCVRRGFWGGGFLAVGFVLCLLSLPAVFGGEVEGVVIGAAVLFPLAMIPFTIGAIIGAFRGRRKLGKMISPDARAIRREGEPETDASSSDAEAHPCPADVSFRPVFRVLGIMWIGVVVGVGLGILLFLPIAAKM
jgi:hypothetical protein